MIVIQTQHAQILTEAFHVRVIQVIMEMDQHVLKINVLAVMVMQLMVQIVLQMGIHLVVPVMMGMF